MPLSTAVAIILKRSRLSGVVNFDLENVLPSSVVFIVENMAGLWLCFKML